jgi:hypothetical protein
MGQRAEIILSGRRHSQDSRPPWGTLRLASVFARHSFVRKLTGPSVPLHAQRRQLIPRLGPGGMW